MQYQRILAYSRKNFCTSESFKASSCPEGMDLDGSGRDGEYTQPQTTLHTHEGAIVEHLDKEGGGVGRDGREDTERRKRRMGRRERRERRGGESSWSNHMRMISLVPEYMVCTLLCALGNSAWGDS